MTTTGEQLKLAGMGQVDENTPDDWKTAADAAIDALAALGRQFTADDVVAMVGVPPNHYNAIGPRFASAAAQGRIVRVGYRQARRSSRHAAVVAVWSAPNTIG